MKTTITPDNEDAQDLIRALTPSRASLVEFADGGFEMVCVESYPSGFTNHRVWVRRHSKGWVCESSARVDREIVADLTGVSAWLRIERCAANPFLATAARAALDYLNNETTITPTAIVPPCHPHPKSKPPSANRGNLTFGCIHPHG